MVLGSNQICNTKVDLGQLILSMGFKVDPEILVFAARLRYLQEHVSSARIDVKAMMATNDASVYDKVDEEVPAAEFLARWERLDDRVSEVAAYRWAVVIGGDGRPPCNYKACQLMRHGYPDDINSKGKTPTNRRIQGGGSGTEKFERGND